MKKYKRDTSRNKKLLIAGAILIIIVLLVAGFFIWRLRTHQTGNQLSDINPPNTVNYDPPTEEEQQQAEEHKKNLGDNNTGTQGSDQTNKRVEPVITYPVEGQMISDVTINSFVPGIIEGDGTCTAVLTHNNLQVSKTSAGFQDASTTWCLPIEISHSEFAEPGQWTLTVNYSSPRAQGASQTRTITVE